MTPTPEQQIALDQIDEGNNVFITGPGGTGKSYLIDAIRTQFDCAVTSTTGISAANIGAVTLHSWSGIGLGQDSAARLANKMSLVNRIKIQQTQRLVIDEVSMLHPNLFTKLDEVFRRVRENEEPCGGLQVIVSGDMYQLPPVNDDRRDRETHYAFESPVWDALGFVTCPLTKIMRQEDEEFQAILNAIRTGEIDGVDFEPLYDRMIDSVKERKGEFTNLQTRNANVDGYNQEILAKLPGKAEIFRSVDTGHERLVKDSRLPQELHLKPGAICLFLANAQKLFNGTVGVITGFQGIGACLKPIFEPLDKSLDSVVVSPVSRKVFQGVERLMATQKGNQWFVNGTEPVEDGEVVDGWVKRPRVVASRTALPLRLGWSITIHKSQGMGIDQMHASVGACFAPGQLYCALSRARTLEGLTLSPFSNLKVSRKVKKFYERAL